MIIDSHVHVWTDDLKQYPLADGYTAADMKPARFTPAELLSHCHPCNVERVVLIQMSYYGFDNSYMLDTMRRYPGVFSGVAVIDHSAAAPEEEMARLGALGVRGFRLYQGSGPAEEWLDHPGYEQMFVAGAESGQAMCTLLNPNGLAALDRMCARHPHTPVVIDHIARIGAGGRIEPADVQMLCSLARHENVKVKISAFYALGKGIPPYDDLAPLIQQVYTCYGARRLMWATDCPYQVQEATYADSLHLVTEGLDFLTAAAQEWMLWRTAEETFWEE